jgi:hypothetical protein
MILRVEKIDVRIYTQFNGGTAGAVTTIRGPLMPKVFDIRPDDIRNGGHPKRI